MRDFYMIELIRSQIMFISVFTIKICFWERITHLSWPIISLRLSEIISRAPPHAISFTISLRDSSQSVLFCAPCVLRQLQPLAVYSQRFRESIFGGVRSVHSEICSPLVSFLRFSRIFIDCICICVLVDFSAHVCRGTGPALVYQGCLRHIIGCSCFSFLLFRPHYS